MNICVVDKRTPAIINKLLAVWESAVRATHDFLTDLEVARIKKLVPQAIQNIETLVIAEDTHQQPIGFMGVDGQKIEMLFVHNTLRGQGTGKKLVDYGRTHYAVTTVTVNEQNPQAIGFYEHLGFKVYKRSETDEQGALYPLLYMRCDAQTEPYRMIRLVDAPELLDQAAKWFHEKWGVPESAYQESMEQCLKQKNAVPQWYVAMESDRIVGGMGVIDNDFHNRKDLTPNVCAVYTESDKRGCGIAGQLLAFVSTDMQARGVDTLYLVTDHTSFYERYGWKFLCMVQGDGEDHLTRMYVYQSAGK